MSHFLLACKDSQPRIFLANNSKVHPLDGPNEVLSTNFIQRNAVAERKEKGRERESEVHKRVLERVCNEDPRDDGALSLRLLRPSFCSFVSCKYALLLLLLFRWF